MGCRGNVISVCIGYGDDVAVSIVAVVCYYVALIVKDRGNVALQVLCEVIYRVSLPKTCYGTVFIVEIGEIIRGAVDSSSFAEIRSVYYIVFGILIA